MIGFPCCLVCFYKFRGILPEPKCYINLYFQISFSIKDIVILLLLAFFLLGILFFVSARWFNLYA